MNPTIGSATSSAARTLIPGGRYENIDLVLVRGNHDKVSSGLESADGFNPIARP